MTVGEQRAAQMRRDLVRVAALGRTLNAVAALTAGEQRYTEPVAAMMRTFHALETRASRSAAAAGVYLGDAAAPAALPTVTDAGWELAEESLRGPSTVSVSAGLRRLEEVEGRQRRGQADPGAEQTCADCGRLYSGLPPRCDDCRQARESRRAADLEAIASRPKPTTISEAWAAISDEDARNTRHEMRQRGFDR
jgi:hypothetical protein